MSDHEFDADRAPVLGEAIDALRTEVPVHAAWRERVLREIEALPTPRRCTLALMGAGRAASTNAGGRKWWWAPRAAAAVAAAAACVVVGSALVHRSSARHAPARAAEAQQRPAPSAAMLTQAAGESAQERFSIQAPGAVRVSLVGDFNQWRPGATPLQRVGDGRSWEVRLALPPGRHVYAFVVDGKLVADPAAPRAADDDFGFPNSVAIIAVSN